MIRGKRYKDFFIRPMNLSTGYNDEYYTKSINPIRTKEPITKKYQDLFGKCFSHHVEPKAFLTSVSCRELIFLEEDAKSDKFFEDDNLSAYFIANHYTPPTLQAYDAIDDNAEYEDFQNYTYQEFRKNILARPWQPFKKEPEQLGSNVVRYLIGDIGKGKSTLATYLYSDIKRNFALYDNYLDIIPIYINVDFENESTSFSKPINPKIYFFEKLYEKAYKAIESHTTRESNKIDLTHFELTCENQIQAVDRLKKLIKFIARRQCRLFFIIDNLDRFQYYHARYAFFEEGSNAMEKSVEGLIWLINECTPSFSDSSLGHAGIGIVFIMRKYVYNYMEGSVDHTTDRDAPVTSIFEIQPVAFWDIINSRTMLLVDALRIINNKLNNEDTKHNLEKYITITKKLENTHENAILMQVSRLGHHGYRSLVDFISSLSIDVRNEILFERFFEKQVHSLLILYITNLRYKYTQRANHSPNLFLNDSVISYTKKDYQVISAHSSHKHTYWLKYFILKYIVKNNGASAIDIIEEFNEFYPNEENLIKHILGSLCTSNEFGCAEVPLSYCQNTDRLQIKPTTRAKELYKNIVTTHPYLA